MVSAGPHVPSSSSSEGWLDGPAGPRAHQATADQLGAARAAHVDDETAGANQRVEPTLASEGLRQRTGALAHVGRFLEALGLGQRLHANA